MPGPFKVEETTREWMINEINKQYEKEMSKTTDIIYVLDRSGSMMSLAEDAIGGFNTFLEEQKKLPEKAKLTTILFDNRYEVLYKRRKLEEVDELTSKEYFARGSTALLDAVGIAVQSVPEDKTKVIVVIMTDGHENSSKEWTKDKIKELINKKRKLGWEFIFSGCDEHAFAEASSLGISAKTISINPASVKGFKTSYAAASAQTLKYRTK